jgi:WxcM-like protein
MTVFDCSLVHLPKVSFPSGSITAVNGGIELPFDVKRVFYIYDIPGGESRGAHAHRKCHQFLVAASGAFEILLDDGRTKRQVLLNRPYMGLHVPPMIWASEINFSSGSICLVLTSEIYSMEDYIRSYDEYLQLKDQFHRIQ